MLFYLEIADGLNCAPKWQINMNSDKYHLTDVNGKNKMQLYIKKDNKLVA